MVRGMNEFGALISRKKQKGITYLYDNKRKVNLARFLQFQYRTAMLILHCPGARRDFFSTVFSQVRSCRVLTFCKLSTVTLRDLGIYDRVPSKIAISPHVVAQSRDLDLPGLLVVFQSIWPGFPGSGSDSVDRIGKAP